MKTLTGEDIDYRAITYFAFAKDTQGKIRQLKITRIHAHGFSPIKSQGWTEKIYKTIEDAEKDMIALNC